MSRQKQKPSNLALGCAVLLAVPALLISAVVLGLSTGLVTVKSGGSCSLPNGATIEIVTDTGGFGASDGGSESTITLGAFATKTYRFSKTEVTREGQVLGQLDPAEQRLTLEATGGVVELRSDDTGRVIFSE